MASRSPVFKNALILFGAQLAGTPVQVLMGVMMGRYLGAEAVGQWFVASTLMRLGILFVEWGHNGIIPATIARDRSLAGEYLGTSLVWRMASFVVVLMALALGSWLWGKGSSFQVLLALVSLQWLFASLSGACQDTTRGFERTDISALGQLGQQTLFAAIVLPILLLGGDLTTAVAGQAAGTAIAGLFVWHATRRAGITGITVSRRAWDDLLRRGSVFLSFGIAMALQANVDVIFLSSLASDEVVGWQSAAQRLVGVLIIPAGALIGALYPTLSRLYAEDREGYVDGVRRALRGTVVLAVPMAACCALYRDVGIRWFGKEEFGPARQNMLVFSVLILLVYVSMPVGTALMAAGRQRAWAAVQALCVAVSLGLNPVLIPWFQRHYGNGGIGVCVAGVVSDIFMVSIGLYMSPRGVVDRALLAVIAKAFAAGGVMIGLGLALASITPYVVAPLTLVAYAAVIWFTGGVDRGEVEGVKDKILRRFKRAPRPEPDPSSSELFANTVAARSGPSVCADAFQ